MKQTPSGPPREFPYDWLKAVMCNDLLEWPEKYPNHAFIGPHAAQLAIDAYDAVVAERDSLARDLNEEINEYAKLEVAAIKIHAERDALHKQVAELRAALSSAEQIIRGFSATAKLQDYKGRCK